MRIAMLEDDPFHAELVGSWLRAAGHTCTVTDSGEAFIRQLGRESFDLLILDWVIPDIAGDEVLGRVRAMLSDMPPVMFVTTRDSEVEIAMILRAGGDDYMVKPVRKLELLARVEALGRRRSAAESEIIEAEPYRIDTAARTLFMNDAPVVLTNTEFELARYLFRNVGRMLSRGHLLESIWGRSANVNTRTVDTYLSRLRKKLSLGPETGWRLSAIYQHGYRLEHVGIRNLEGAGGADPA